MRKLLIVVALGLPSLARAAAWTLDPAHTSVQFSVRHLMVSTVRGALGKVRAAAQATTKINRKDFGVTWNQALEAGGVAVGDEVTITIDVEATKETAAGG